MSAPKKRILVVDDYGDSCAAMSLRLQALGYEAASVLTLQEALRLARDQSFDLYILDLKFPDGSGFELCRQIRSFDHQTPIIFHSGAARDVDEQMARAAGAQAFFQKPCSLEELDQTIVRLLGKPRTDGKAR